MSEQAELVSVEAVGHVFCSGETRVSFERIEEDAPRAAPGDKANPLSGSYWFKIATSTGTVGEVPGRRDVQILIPPGAMVDIVTGLMQDQSLRRVATNAAQDIAFRERQAGR
jgi:hypothetical protein